MEDKEIQKVNASNEEDKTEYQTLEEGNDETPQEEGEKLKNNEEATAEENTQGKEEKTAEKEEVQKLKTSDKVFIGITSTVIVLLLTYILLFSFVFFNVAVSGRSMENTLSNGDVLIVNKLATPNYGDVIIVKDLKDNGEWLVKRVIALEGDTVVIKDGNVYRNGELLVEDYAKGKTYAPDCRDEENTHEITYTVGEGEIFFLGDNREDSLDSRYYGKCTIDNVQGVVSEFAIQIKGITTPVNQFFTKIKSFFGIKTSKI